MQKLSSNPRALFVAIAAVAAIGAFAAGTASPIGPHGDGQKGAMSAAPEPISGRGEQTTLPNGWRVTPAGSLVRLPGDMPLKIVPVPDGTDMLVVTAGFHDHSIDVIDTENATLRQKVLLGKAWGGLAFDANDNSIYVSGGGPVTDDLRQAFGRTPPPPGEPYEHGLVTLAPNVKAAVSTPVLRLAWNAGDLRFRPPLNIGGLAEKARFVAGIAADGKGHLFVVNIGNDTIYKLAIVGGQVLASARLGYRPNQLSLSPDGNTVAVANWGDRSVSILGAKDLKAQAQIKVGVHPTDLAYAPDGRLFVANAGSNSVTVIRRERAIETIMTSLLPGDPVGSTPNALAVSKDGSRLYVANADNNDIAVVDVHDSGHSRVLGFIPTGWYPSALALTPDGKRLVVGIAKGIDSRANWPGLGGGEKISHDHSKIRFDYIGRTMTGYAEIIPVPGADQLAAYSRQVRSNFPLGQNALTAVERAEGLEAFRHIKHVLYIIKENHTYDEDLGDEPRGDGLESLVLFGRNITPNIHAIVRRTVLLDRYFVNGQVSLDGHFWATSAYSTTFNERETATFYGGRGGPKAGYFESEERLHESPAGHLWDLVGHAGLSYYSYGEFADFKGSPGSKPVFVGSRGLKGHASAAWNTTDDRHTVWALSDVDRARIFVNDLKAADRTGQWPNFVMAWLNWNHTAGLTPGLPTPQAAVANNDLALGMMIEAVTHSRFWGSTAIFVTEDDAQDGPDHVDAHRSVALVISPYVKPQFVDHTHYTMTSIVRTMELVLGLPPMTQYDRDATPMYRLFQSKPILWTYSAQPETVDIRAVNPKTGSLEKASLKLDFSAPDRADPEALNALLWAALKPGIAIPAPVRSYSGTQRFSRLPEKD